MTRPEILDTAKKCVCGDREQDYGTPEQNFGTIAQLWTAYKGIELTAVDVAIFLSLVKIGRIASGHGKADNWIDLAGYAACGGEIESAQDVSVTVTSTSDTPHRPTQAELEDMFDAEPNVCGETPVALGTDKPDASDGWKCLRGYPDCLVCPLSIKNNKTSLPCLEYAESIGIAKAMKIRREYFDKREEAHDKKEGEE